MARSLRAWLVIRADGAMRVRSRRPSSADLRLDEVAIALAVNIPTGWGSVYPAEIVIDMPEPPTVTHVKDDDAVLGAAQ